MDTLFAFLTTLAGLAPVVVTAAPLIAQIVDALKKFGIVKNGDAPAASAIFNFIVFAIYFFVGTENAGQVDSALSVITVLAPFVIGYFGALYTTGFAHKLAVTFGFGFTHTKPSSDPAFKSGSG